LARPLTHDLLSDVFTTCAVQLHRVEIHTLKDNTFFARLLCEHGSESCGIDARPSDAIALAVRLSVPIFVADSILQQAGINYETRQQQEPTTLDILQQQLQQAVNDEQYEEAARLRDQIRKVTGHN
jgi:bifunctional DNase/RNase